MTIAFYAGSGSPYVWRVWLALEHKQLAYELRMLSFDRRDTRSPEFLAINPRGRVPAIVDDGFVVYESAAIVEYLDAAYPARPLVPHDIRAAATVRRMVREIDEYGFVPLERLIEQVLFTDADRRDEATIARERGLVIDELAYWEQTLAGRDWLAGAELTAADVTLYPMIALVRRIAPRHASASMAEHIGQRTAAWAARVEALPYYRATYPPHWAA